MSTAYQEMLAVLEDLQESAAYWSEYDVPIGIVDRINAAITKAKDTSEIQVTYPQIQATSAEIQVTSVNARRLEALKVCRDQFKHYVDHHLDKGDLDKAAQNEKFVALADAAITGAETPKNGD